MPTEVTRGDVLHSGTGLSSTGDRSDTLVQGYLTRVTALTLCYRVIHSRYTLVQGYLTRGDHTDTLIQGYYTLWLSTSEWTGLCTLVQGLPRCYYTLCLHLKLRYRVIYWGVTTLWDTLVQGIWYLPRGDHSDIHQHWHQGAYSPSSFTISKLSLFYKFIFVVMFLI